MKATAHTARDVAVTYLENIGTPYRITIPKGTRVVFVQGQPAVDDVPLLVRLTGNTWDPIHRYCWLPFEAMQEETTP